MDMTILFLVIVITLYSHNTLLYIFCLIFLFINSFFQNKISKESKKTHFRICKQTALAFTAPGYARKYCFRQLNKFNYL